MKTVDVSVEELQKELWRMARVYNITTFGEKDANGLINETVKMDAHPNSGGHFVYKDELPFIALCNGKAYLLDQQPQRRNQDASDLVLYDEITALAFARYERDDETCIVVSAIHNLLVNPLQGSLAVEAILNKGSEVPTSSILYMRGRILRAKFNAVTIWREGQPKKEQK